MRFILKGPEPAELEAHKAAANEDWKPTYDNLDVRPVREALVREQGYLCGYCGARVGEQSGDCHLEHLVPQSERDDLALTYTNMIASCQGTDGRSRIPEHCGHTRGTKRVPVSPLSPDCETFFEFGSNGAIVPVADAAKREAAKETIKNLGLGVSRLVAARKAAIDAAIEYLRDRPPEDWQAEAIRYDQADAHGRLEQFCFAVRRVLLNHA